jgi:hypothetical protein
MGMAKNHAHKINHNEIYLLFALLCISNIIKLDAWLITLHYWHFAFSYAFLSKKTYLKTLNMSSFHSCGSPPCAVGKKERCGTFFNA